MYAMNWQAAKREFLFCSSFQNYNVYGKTVLNWWIKHEAAESKYLLDLLQEPPRAAYYGLHLVKVHLGARRALRREKEGLQPDQRGQDVGDGRAVAEECFKSVALLQYEDVSNHGDASRDTKTAQNSKFPSSPGNGKRGGQSNYQEQNSPFHSMHSKIKPIDQANHPRYVSPTT